jgi:hypothetical protein
VLLIFILLTEGEQDNYKTLSGSSPNTDMSNNITLSQSLSHETVPLNKVSQNFASIW